MGKNKIFSLITMSQERALQDSNKTNMVSSTIFYSKEKKKGQKHFYNNFFRPHKLFFI